MTYSISSGDKTGSFVIDSKTGVIQQTSHRTPSLIGPYYTLNISASDGYHVSEAIVVVAVQDVNNYKPVFTECDSYRPVVTEHRPPGTFVFKVGLYFACMVTTNYAINQSVYRSINQSINQSFH